MLLFADNIYLQNMKSKSIVSEACILGGLFILVLIVVHIMFGIPLLAPIKYEIALNDTYLVLNWRILVLTPFLLTAVIVYLVKEAFYSFKRQLPNWIVLILNFLLVMQLIDHLEFSSNPGWRVDPPLLALARTPNAYLSDSQNYTNFLMHIKVTLFAAAILFIITMIFISMMIGRNRTKNNHA
jgi:hypothetical protein